MEDERRKMSDGTYGSGFMVQGSWLDMSDV
jgi:hypothetical protein